MKTSLVALAVVFLSSSAFAQDSERVISRVTLNDGQELHGYVVERTDEKVLLELTSGGRMELPSASVRTITSDERVKVDGRGELRSSDPSRTRYFYSPSGFMLRQGEGYFSQKELFFSSVAYGVTDNISVLAGSVLPAWLAGPYGMNFIIGAKGGGQVAPGIHLAAGLETLMLPNIGFGGGGMQPVFAGFLFGTATIGSEDTHMSVSLGRPFFLSQFGSANLFQVIATVSGSARLNKHVALVSENWIIPSSTSTMGLVSGGVRLMAGRIAVDVGGIWMVSTFGSSAIPLPWLDFTYNFG